MSITLHGTRASNTDVITPDTTGTILQVVQSEIATTQNTTSTGYTTSNLTASITPSSTSSKIMLSARFMGEYGTATNYDLVFFILRGSTKINVGVSEGDRTTGTIANFMGFYNADADNTPDGTQLVTLDASHNSTSQLTYHIGLQTRNADTMYVNRTVGDSNSTATERFSSEIIAMEIKG